LRKEHRPCLQIATAANCTLYQSTKIVQERSNCANGELACAQRVYRLKLNRTLEKHARLNLACRPAPGLKGGLARRSDAKREFVEACLSQKSDR
jgi:hypothetical protein